MSLPGTQHACIVIVGQSPCPVYSPSRTHRHCTLKSVSTYTGPSQPGHTVSASFLCSYTCRLSLTFRFSASEQPTLSCIIHRHSIVPFVCQIQTFIHQQINEHFALMCGGTAWQPRVLFGQSCHLCLEEQTLCNYLNFFALCPYYFAKLSRKWTLKILIIEEKNHRSHKSIQWKKEEVSQCSYFGRSLTPTMVLADLNPVNCDSLIKEKNNIKDTVKCWKIVEDYAYAARYN